MAKGGSLYLMQKDRAKLLRQAAKQMGVNFSRSDREKNPGERFAVAKIVPLSDASAAVFYRKTPGKKLALAWFYWLNRTVNPTWQGFFLSYNHLTSLERLKEMLDWIETENFPKNFDDDERTD
jgi:hypothetical protein